MGKTKTKNNMCSLDEELMMCCAYRYAIGRHTYVNDLANYIAKNYYNRLSPERLAFTAKDIRNQINDVLRFGPVDISYDGTVSYDERDALNDLLTWMNNNNIYGEEALADIDRLEIYKESYSPDSPKKYREYSCVPMSKKFRTQMDIDDLLNWYTLSCVFDKTRYKKLHLNYNNEDHEIIAVQSWRQATQELEDKPGYCKLVAWKWEPCWVSVDNFLEKGDCSGYIVNDYITSIEDVL